jgi:hypothetical protein
MRNVASIVVVLIVAATCAHAKWALVTQGEVREVWSSKPNFHPEAMRSIYSVSNAVEVGWRKVGDDYLPPKTKAETDRDSFDAKRTKIKEASSIKARKKMADEFLYKLDGTLDDGYPDKTQPVCVTTEGENLTLSDFMDYIQMKDDDPSTPQQEIQALKQKAKAARQYFKSLKP